MITRSCKTSQSMLPELGQSLRNLNRFSKGFVTLVSEQVGLFVDRTLNLAEGTIYTPLLKPKGVCDFPELEPCCPEVACTLIREVFPGECVVEPILVRNLGKEDIKFKFTAGSMEDSNNNKAGEPVVDPDKVSLGPGKSTRVTIRYDTKSFKEGRRYTADIKVNGHCEQTIHLVAHVIPLDAARCTIAQKEYIKARRHDWRDHFYCEPPEPRTKAKTTTE